MRNRTSIALLAATLALTAGCAQTGRWTRADYDLSYNLPLQDRASLANPYDESDVEDLSARIYLISDNQRHELLGDGVEWFRNAIADRIASVAVRPPPLDLFGQDLLGEALAVTDGFILHLGDACDVSNTGEFGRFAWDMRDAPQGWVMAPGNHDGFFFGNSSRTRDSLIAEWNAAAETYEVDGTTITSRAMQKDRYVSYYLASLILQDRPWSGPLARSLGPQIENRFARWTRQDDESGAAQAPRTFAEYWTELVALQDQIYRQARTVSDGTYTSFELPQDLAPSNQPHLRRIAWHIDKKRVWRSFVLQEVDISATSTAAGNREPVSILVLDTSQYSMQPSLDHGLPSRIFEVLTFGFFDFQVAGETGSMTETQEAATDAFTTSMTGEGRSWMLASHHPYDSLGRAAGPRFDRIREAGQIPVTLSGHTHSGEIRWNYDGENEGDWLEINVGSLLDAPVEFRDLQVHRLGERLAISSYRRQMEDVLREKGLLLDDIPGYRPAPGDPDYYRDFDQSVFGSEDDVDFLVKRTLLAAYLRMLRLFEADDPDQGLTRWPTGPGGLRLESHREVTDAVQNLLATVRIDDVKTLTQFLYELREFDRTRKFTDETGERLRAYRLSQAIWASRVELHAKERRSVAMDPDISFLVLPLPVGGSR